MDRIGFRSMLEQRRLPEEVIEASLAMAERFEDFLVGKPASADTAWAFSKSLIEEGKNTEQNYLALIRYCLFINKPAMYVALLELVDGGEVSDNLYRKIGESYGQAVRDEVFAGIGIAPYGTPTPEKPAFIHPVIGKLEMKVGEQKCADFLSASLRDLPEEHFRGERNKYLQAGGIDAYLAQRKEAFVLELEKCLREGRPFYAQHDPCLPDRKRSDHEAVLLLPLSLGARGDQEWRRPPGSNFLQLQRRIPQEAFRSCLRVPGQGGSSRVSVARRFVLPFCYSPAGRGDRP
jgi:hypothetical protein